MKKKAREKTKRAAKNNVKSNNDKASPKNKQQQVQYAPDVQHIQHTQQRPRNQQRQ